MHHKGQHQYPVRLKQHHDKQLWEGERGDGGGGGGFIKDLLSR